MATISLGKGEGGECAATSKEGLEDSDGFEAFEGFQETDQFHAAGKIR